MTEDELYIYTLSEERLSVTDQDVLKLRCCVVDCERYMSVKDFGISPLYRRGKKWLNLNETIFYCGKHMKQYKNGDPLNYKAGAGINHIN